MVIWITLVLLLVVFVSAVIIVSLTLKTEPNDDADTRLDKRMKTLIIIGWMVLFFVLVIMFIMLYKILSSGAKERGTLPPRRSLK